MIWEADMEVGQFTAPDLAHIAHSFDTLEQGTLDEASRQSTSTNMDDTGALNNPTSQL